MASANASALPTCVRRPHLPFSRISAGPEGQSVDTTGVPQARASTMTFPNPSSLDDKTKISRLVERCRVGVKTCEDNAVCYT